MTDKIKLRKTWFNSNMVITYLIDGRINYWARKSDYSNMPENLPETATEYSYVKRNLKDYTKSKIHTVKIKRYYAKDYE